MRPSAADDAPSADEPRAWVAAHGDRLLRSAYLLCGDEAEAQDLVQETLLQALRGRNRFRGGCAVYSWLHGILLNLSRHYWRKRVRYIVDAQPAADAVSPDRQDADREYRAMTVMQALDALSPEHRAVIVLRFYEDLKLQEIAVRTHVSVGTVKSRLHYAIAALEKLLPPELNVSAGQGTHNQTPS